MNLLQTLPLKKKTIAFGFALFLLLYLENFGIFSIKISHIWKIILIYFILLTNILRIKINPGLTHQPVPPTIVFGYLYALWPLIISFSVEDPISSLIFAGTRLFPVLVFQYLVLKNLKEQTLVELINTSVIFVALTALPFVLGIIEPIGKTYDIAQLSRVEANSFIGVFQKPHAASLTFFICSIIAIINFFEEDRRKQKILWFCLSIFLINLLLLVYVRAGILAAFLSLICYLILKKKLKVLIWSGIFFLIIYYVFVNVVPDRTSFKLRMMGKSIRTEDQRLNANTLSSGRLKIWSSAIKIFLKQDTINKITGIGLRRMKNEVAVIMKRGHVAHNGFLDELLMHGIVGVSFMILYIVAIFKDIWKNHNKKYQHMGLSLFCGMLFFIFVQGFDAPLQLLMFSPFILLPYCSDRLFRVEISSTKS